MRLIATLVASFIICNCCYGQNSLNGLYMWHEAVLMQPSDISGNPLIQNGVTAAPILSLPNQKFRVIQTVNNNADVVIKILDYTAKNAVTIKTAHPNKKYQTTSRFFLYNFEGDQSQYENLPDEQTNTRYYGSRQRYFTVPVAVLTDAHLVTRERKIAGGLSAGIINFPFKYRLQKDKTDFSGAFNFGAGVGYKFAHKEYNRFNWSVISGYSISNVVLDSASANKNQGALASTNNFTAFSFSLGLLTEYDRVQVGAFIGFDQINRINQRQFDWQYQGKPWLSVGFGFAIFSVQKEKAETTAAQ